MDYRVLCFIALACWGAWGFVSKLLSRHAEPGAIAFWATATSMAPIALYAAVSRSARWTKPIPGALAAGLLAGVATVAFYIALRRGPASVVVPLTGLYVLIPAILGFVVLKEPVTVSHVIGLACAGLAVFFLSR